MLLATYPKQYALGLVFKCAPLLLFLRGKTDLAFILMKVNKIDLLHVNVQVAKPFINISPEFGFNIFEGIGLIINWTVYQRHFEFSLVYLEITINDGKGAPAHGDVV